MKETVPVEEAVGMVLPHDITEIVKDSHKGRLFKKGHIIQAEDIEHLKRIGKEHIYVLSLEDDEIHENEAAEKLAEALIGEGAKPSSEPVEGKINILASRDGLLKINKEALYHFNLLGEVMCATLHDNTPVKKDELIGGTRLIPLISKRAIVDDAVAISNSSSPVIQVKPLHSKKIGLVITGSEVFNGLIEDRFESVLREKVKEFGSQVIKVCFAPDDIQIIRDEIHSCLDAGAELVVTSGGMSVDPDDVTRPAIKEAGAVDIVYGSPVLPGAMFLSGRIGEVPILGVPACGMFFKITIFDLILPRVLTGEKINREDIAQMGHGGLCRNCKNCQYPVCNFGK